MENVMLNSIQTQIKIVDFGLSNIWSKDQLLQTHCGSPEYAAPELFVSGKQYGPEVDLWSLGIILYGMVVGQLPFVCEKRENLSSQERRKNLIMQINRGLASNQKRSLATFSTDFRHLVNVLLNADASKRLTAKNLISHPWITEKDKKYIRTNPLKSLDKQIQIKIISEISNLCTLSLEQVIEEIRSEKLGPFGGMYHILSRRFRINQLNGDGITKALSSYVFDSCSYRFPSEMHSKEVIKLTNPGSSRYIRPSTTIKPRIVESENRTEEKAKNILDYRQLQSSTLRRKVYSASITTKLGNTPIEGNSRYEGDQKKSARQLENLDQPLEKLNQLLMKKKRPISNMSKSSTSATAAMPKMKPISASLINKSPSEQTNKLIKKKSSKTTMQEVKAKEQKRVMSSKITERVLNTCEATVKNIPSILGITEKPVYSSLNPKSLGIMVCSKPGYTALSCKRK